MGNPAEAHLAEGQNQPLLRVWCVQRRRGWGPRVARHPRRARTETHGLATHMESGWVSPCFGLDHVDIARQNRQCGQRATYWPQLQEGNDTGPDAQRPAAFLHSHAHSTKGDNTAMGGAAREGSFTTDDNIIRMTAISRGAANAMSVSCGPNPRRVSTLAGDAVRLPARRLPLKCLDPLAQTSEA